MKLPSLQRRTLALIAVIVPLLLLFVYVALRSGPLAPVAVTLTTVQSIPAPWYQFPPIDFVAENLVPGQIRDHHCLDFQLKPQMVVPTEQLLSRAEQLRRGAGIAVQD